MIKKVKPSLGQDSVWDYPRPPAIEKVSKHIRIVFNKEVICDTQKSFRILETSHPPTYYIPIEAFKPDSLIRSDQTSFCEFKGKANYYHISLNGKTVHNAAWGYSNPEKPYHSLQGHVCVYAQFMDACYINDECVTPQPGGFYGGWITHDIVGPFKGQPGSWGW